MRRFNLPSESYIQRLSLADLILLITIFLSTMLLQFLPIMKSSLSWEDETLYSSLSLVLLRGGTTPTILAEFPGTHSRFELYGPVTFRMGELL
jgi:hypothetical protein